MEQTFLNPEIPWDFLKHKQSEHTNTQTKKENKM